MFSAVKYVLRAIGKREKNNARRQDGVLENDLKHACNKNWPINMVLPFFLNHFYESLFTVVKLALIEMVILEG